MPQTLKCPSCGAPLQYDGRTPSIKCEYCNNVTLLPEEFRQDESSGKLAQIHEQLRRGRKIEAIKIYRETFKVGLKEAKDAVESLERGEAINLPIQQNLLSVDDRFAQVKDQLQRGRKIEAIKIYRQAFNVGLKEAKEAVERLERGETINLPGQQKMVVGSVDAASHLPGQVVLGGQPNLGQRSGCVSGFLGQFGCLLFLFFWIPFLLVMVGPLIYPDMVLLTAPLACEAGYQEVYAERVGYYSTGNFEGNNIVLLHCVYEPGADDIPHPFKVDAILFAGPMAVLAVLAFGIALFGRLGSLTKI